MNNLESWTLPRINFCSSKAKAYERLADAVSDIDPLENIPYYKLPVSDQPRITIRAKFSAALCVCVSFIWSFCPGRGLSPHPHFKYRPLAEANTHPAAGVRIDHGGSVLPVRPPSSVFIPQVFISLGLRLPPPPRARPSADIASFPTS